MTSHSNINQMKACVILTIEFPDLKQEFKISLYKHEIPRLFHDFEKKLPDFSLTCGNSAVVVPPWLMSKTSGLPTLSDLLLES